MSRIGAEVPSVNHFKIIKQLYKKVAKQVVKVNNTFKLLLSWIIILNLLYILSDGFNGIQLLRGAAIIENGTIYFVSDETKRVSVRMLTFLVLSIMAKLVLILMVIIQLIFVNDQSKSTVLYLNDFVTQFKGEISAADYYSVSN